MSELLPCPFCGSKNIKFYDCDDDSFIKTIVAQCQGEGCNCQLETRIDWASFSKTNDRRGYDIAWKAKILALWNRRAPVSEQAEPVAWHTEDHLTDKSATTYDREVAERWAKKGWPVYNLYYAAPPAKDKDAARYRFLRDKAYGQNGALALLPPDEMDAAIDAAMGQQEGGKS